MSALTVLENLKFKGGVNCQNLRFRIFLIVHEYTNTNGIPEEWFPDYIKENWKLKESQLDSHI